MAGYDDSETIAEVLRRLARDPRLSRRQSIIQVAGEDQLRRIEIKMATAEAGQGQGVPLRRAIAEEHALDFPMSLDEREGGCVFSYQGHDEARSGTVGLAACPFGEDMRFVATRGFAGKSGASRRMVSGGRFELFEVGGMQGLDADVRGNLADLGLLGDAVSGLMKDGTNQVALGLAGVLAERWEAHGFPADRHMTEAVAHEGARMEACGLGKLRSAIGRDGLRVMSALKDDRIVAEVPSRSSKARVAMLAGAGGLAMVVQDVEASSPGEALREALVGRAVRAWIGPHRPTEDEVASFIGAFSDVRLAPIPHGVVCDLVLDMPDIDFGRMPDTASKAALVRFAGQVDQGEGALDMLGAFRDAGLPYAEALAFTGCMSDGEVRLRMAEYADLMSAAAWAVARRRDPDLVVQFEAPVEAQDAARAVLATPLTTEEGLALAMRWRDAGRPGHVDAYRGKGSRRRTSGPGRPGPDGQALRGFLAREGRPLPEPARPAIVRSTNVREFAAFAACLVALGSVAGATCGLVLGFLWR